MTVPELQTNNLSNKFFIDNDTIYFYNDFDEPLDEYYDIINSVKHLKFSDPPNDQIKHSTYEPSLFNKSMLIPPNLTSIVFSQKFNHPINLTPELTCVHFGSDFDQPLACPKKLIRLEKYKSFEQSIILPKYLEHLTTYHTFQKSPFCLNKNIKFITGSYVPIQMTKKLLDFFGTLNGNQQPNLSKNLIHLTLCTNYCIEYFVLPKNIKTISIIGWINPFILTPRIISIKSWKPLPNIIIEQSVKKIDIINPTLMECLPNTVTHIVVSSLNLTSNIPSSIQHIKVNEEEHRSKNKPPPNVIIEYPKCLLCEENYKCLLCKKKSINPKN